MPRRACRDLDRELIYIRRGSRRMLVLSAKLQAARRRRERDARDDRIRETEEFPGEGRNQFLSDACLGQDYYRPRPRQASLELISPLDLEGIRVCGECQRVCLFIF